METQLNLCENMDSETFEVYDPIFSKVRTFGSIETPLFIAKDVQDALELKDLNYKREDSIFTSKDKVKIKIMTRGGAQDTIAFTEQGLYKAIFHSKTPKALQFQTFVTIVMQKLRTKGHVTMEDATDELKKRIAILDKECEDQHEKYLQTQDRLDQMEQHRDDLLDELSRLKNSSLWELQQKIEKLQERYMLKMWLNYDGDDEPAEDDIIDYTFSLKKTPKSVYSVFIHKDEYPNILKKITLPISYNMVCDIVNV